MSRDHLILRANIFYKNVTGNNFFLVPMKCRYKLATGVIDYVHECSMDTGKLIDRVHCYLLIKYMWNTD